MYLIGIDPTQVWTSTETPPFKLGETAMDDLGNIYTFVRADGGGVPQWYVAAIESSTYTADQVETTTSAPGDSQGYPVGVAPAAIGASGYGWLLRNGIGSCRVAASAAKGTILNSTATAGQLDDDATAGSEVIDGISLLVANGGAAGVVSAIFSWPRIGRTL
jgi:hypothetical protein